MALTRNDSILIATRNEGKTREIRHVMHDVPVRWMGLDNWPNLPEPIEDADTFEDNAILKATYYSTHTQSVALADDSGLEVDALGGAPGVRSARYAGSPSDDQANNRKLINALRHVTPSERTARFRCAVAVADGNAIIAMAHGVIEGVIVDKPRGQNGFGYDPHFLVPEFGITTAEMPPHQKNSLSHRGRALEAVKSRLIDLLRS